MPKPTEEQVKKYVGDGGTRCVFCESDDILGGGRETDTGVITQEVSCNSCHEEWVDVCVLEDVYYRGEEG